MSGYAFTEFIRADDAGRLRVEDRDAVELAAEFGTPLYVLSENQIRHNTRAISRAFGERYPDTQVLFSNKANNNPAVRRIFNQEGAGGDCFGYGELYLSLISGTDPSKLMLNGSNKQAPELTLAIESGVTINLDSIEELAMVEAIARRVGRRALVSPRTRLELRPMDDLLSDWPRGIPIGPGARGHKFGMHFEDVLACCRLALASEWLELTGLHHHAGRWTNDLALNRAVVSELVTWAARLRDALDWTPRHLDIGGGLAWGRPEGHGPDNADRTAPNYDAYAEAITSTLCDELTRFGLDRPTLIIEPGRALASNIGILLTTVGMVKSDADGKTWVNVDTSQNHLPNILSAGWYYHAVAAAQATPRPEDTANVDLVGPLCTFDLMGGARRLPALARGDVVAFLDTGAYAETKAALFNAQPRPATVLVRGNRADVITERETLRDVISRYRVPARLLVEGD